MKASILSIAMVEAIRLGIFKRPVATDVELEIGIN